MGCAVGKGCALPESQPSFLMHYGVWLVFIVSFGLFEAGWTRSKLHLCRSEDEGFPGVDYNDVYKISQAFVSQHDDKEDLPDAELASLGSISVADLEAADFEVASEGSVF